MTLIDKQKTGGKMTIKERELEQRIKNLEDEINYLKHLEELTSHILVKLFGIYSGSAREAIISAYGKDKIEQYGIPH